MSKALSKLIPIIFISLFLGCAIGTPKISPYSPTVKELNSVIDSVTQVSINKTWLHDFKIKNKKRPIVLVAPVINQSNIELDLFSIRKNLTFSLLETGSVRILNNSYSSPGFTANELVQKTSSDFVFSSEIITEKTNNKSVLIFRQNIWDGINEVPIESTEAKITK